MTGDFSGSNGIFREATAGCGEVLQPNHMSRFICGAKIFGLGPSVFNVTQNVTELSTKRAVVSYTMQGSILSGHFQDIVHSSLVRPIQDAFHSSKSTSTFLEHEEHD